MPTHQIEYMLLETTAAMFTFGVSATAMMPAAIRGSSGACATKAGSDRPHQNYALAIKPQRLQAAAAPCAGYCNTVEENAAVMQPLTIVSEAKEQPEEESQEPADTVSSGTT